MLLHDDILIIGDSFVKDRSTQNHWPYKLKQLLMKDSEVDSRPTKGWGLAGVAWWSTRGRLIHELQYHVPKILIIVHTEAIRIPSDLDFPLNIGSINIYNHKQLMGGVQSNDNRSLFTSELTDAARDYFKYLCSIPFMEWATQRWYDELDQIIDQHKIEKVIHLHGFGFQRPPETHVFRTGVTVNQKLWNNSDDANFWHNNNKTFPNPQECNTYNHFSISNNSKIAHSLYNLLMNYNPGLNNVNLLE